MLLFLLITSLLLEAWLLGNSELIMKIHETKGKEDSEKLVKENINTFLWATLFGIGYWVALVWMLFVPGLQIHGLIILAMSCISLASKKKPWYTKWYRFDTAMSILVLGGAIVTRLNLW